MCACVEEMHFIINFPDPMVIIIPQMKLAMNWGVGGNPPPNIHDKLDAMV